MTFYIFSIFRKKKNQGPSDVGNYVVQVISANIVFTGYRELSMQ